MTKYIHAFSDPITDEIDQSLIGNKGYNLCLMHGMDLPIPEGFIINANATKEYKIQNNFSDKKENDDLDKGAEDLRLATRHLGMIVGKVDVDEILGSIFNDFCIGK